MATTEMTINPHDHIGLVMNHLGRYVVLCNERGDRTQVEDLMGIGWDVLCDACRTFKPEKGFKPSTHICNALKWQVHRRHLIARGHVEISRCNGRKAPDGRPSRDRVFLNRPYTFGVFYNGKETDHTEFDVVDRRDEARVLFGKLSDVLTASEREVVEMLASGLTRTEVGKKLGVSRERVRQIHERIVRKCKAEADRIGIEHPLVPA